MQKKASSAPHSGEKPRSDRSHWNWLLLIPIVIPLLPFLYNAADPKLGGFPLFYWAQLSFVALGCVTTTLVYQLTKRKR
ncbi:MAG: hypothetical protein DLM55_07020 [Acidimicrobiales bacterium]|nr:MAG: hypothetical protein DLM55_07020 [Acidimicrobiales bacterium]